MPWAPGSEAGMARCFSHRINQPNEPRRNKLMKTKTLIATALVAISGIAASGASAADKVDTQVSIKGNNGDYYGYVHSASNQEDCESGRKVNVYKMLGASPDRQNDLKI